MRDSDFGVAVGGFTKVTSSSADRMSALTEKARRMRKAAHEADLKFNEQKVKQTKESCCCDVCGKIFYRDVSVSTAVCPYCGHKYSYEDEDVVSLTKDSYY